MVAPRVNGFGHILHIAKEHHREIAIPFPSMDACYDDCGEATGG